MTPEQTKYAISVMQGFAEGKKVLEMYRGSWVWRHTGSPDWDWANFYYKLAPDPEADAKSAFQKWWEGLDIVKGCDPNFHRRAGDLSFWHESAAHAFTAGYMAGKGEE